MVRVSSTSLGPNVRPISVKALNETLTRSILSEGRSLLTLYSVSTEIISHYYIALHVLAFPDPAILLRKM